MTGIPNDVEDIEELLVEAEETLPQSKIVGVDRIRQWLSQVEAIEPGTAEWHLRRQYGFGGSDAGPLVTSWRGEHYPFSSAHDICKQKLFLTPPDPEEDATRRGRRAETLIRHLFEEQVAPAEGLQFDNNAIRTVCDTRPEGREWLVANPDALYRTPNGGFHLVDFKAPRADILEEYRRNGLLVDYRAQLHHYRMVAEAAGLPIESMSVVCFDYDRWQVEPFNVAYDADLENDLIEAGETFWRDYVLQDCVPSYTGARPVNLSDVPTEVHTAATRFAAYKRIESRAKNKAGDERRTIEAWVQSAGLVAPEKSVQIDDTRIGEDLVYDTNRMLERLRELGADDEQIARCRGRPDLDGDTYTRAYEHLLDAAKSVIAGSDGAHDALNEAVSLAPKAPTRKNQYKTDLLADLLRRHGERPERYMTRRLSTQLTKKTNQATQERQLRAQNGVDTLVRDLAAPHQPEDALDVANENAQTPDASTSDADDDVARFLNHP